MSEDEIIDSGVPLPRIASVKPVLPGSLEVKWADGPREGLEDLVDVRPMIFSYKVYRPLRTEKLFLTAHIADEGNAVAWEGSGDLAMSADMIHSLAEQMLTPQAFAAFLKRNDLTQEAAAALLGRSRRQIATYATTGPIPRIVAWACYGFEEFRHAQTMRESFGGGGASNNRAA